MKPLLMALSLIVYLLLCWGCTYTTVKSGSDQQESSVESQSQTESLAEQSKGERSTDAGRESAQAPDPQEDAEGVEKREAAEDGAPVLNIDEEKEADSIHTVIEILEDCYRTRNYDRWLSLLTHAYRDHFDDPNTLASEGWDATNIREFFDLLVSVRRRGNIRDLEISRVEFVSDYKAFVYVILGGEEFPEPQHTFIRIGETWYKGLSTEEV
jgi:hypothetical protein